LNGFVAAAVDVRVDVSDGSDLQISYSLPRRGPDWFAGAKVDVDAIDAEVDIAAALRRGSLCDVTATDAVQLVAY
jgi:hypothetical protein